jgi:hypothetical protein
MECTLKMEAIRSSETLVGSYITTRCHHPEDYNSHGLPFTYFGGELKWDVCFLILSLATQSQTVDSGSCYEAAHCTHFQGLRWGAMPSSGCKLCLTSEEQ